MKGGFYPDVWLEKTKKHIRYDSWLMRIDFNHGPPESEIVASHTHGTFGSDRQFTEMRCSNTLWWPSVPRNHYGVYLFNKDITHETVTSISSQKQSRKQKVTMAAKFTLVWGSDVTPRGDRQALRNKQPLPPPRDSMRQVLAQWTVLICPTLMFARLGPHSKQQYTR
jgi:hypothetical protein